MPTNLWLMTRGLARNYALNTPSEVPLILETIDLGSGDDGVSGIKPATKSRAPFPIDRPIGGAVGCTATQGERTPRCRPILILILDSFCRTFPVLLGRKRLRKESHGARAIRLAPETVEREVGVT